MIRSLESVTIIFSILFCTQISSIHSIINGRDPKLNEVRYEVAVLSNGGLCSGGIIGNKYVITAAHCIKVGEHNKLKPTRVIAATNRTKNYDPKVSILKYVKRAFVLAAFAKQKPFHDIAVLELSGSIGAETDEKLQVLELPTPIKLNPVTYQDYYGKIFKAAGFGSTNFKTVQQNGKSKPETYGGGKLQVANAVILKDKNCIKAYGGNLKNRMCYAIIQDAKKKHFQGFCSGDSGTPIVIDGKTIIGVHIAGGNCNNNFQPSIGIRVPIFISFIKNAMAGTITSDMKVYNAW